MKLKVLLIACLFTLGSLAFPFDIQCSSKYFGHTKHNHQYYNLCYLTSLKNPEWVKWTVEPHQIKVARPKVSFEQCGASSKDSDFYKSDYDRGHLCPNGDMNFSVEAATNTFKCCNLSPQPTDFNKGVWKRLESHTRDLAKVYGKVTIVAGPIFYQSNFKYLPNTKVAIPDAFFRIVVVKDKVKEAYILDAKLPKASNFENYKSTIPEIEKATGLKFLKLKY